MCRMLRHNPKQSHTITQMHNFFPAPAPCRKSNMILITNKTIAASKMERRQWLHNQALWVWRQVNPKSRSGIVNDFNTISEQAGNDKFLNAETSF